MADKSLTIKNASDQELLDLLMRLRREAEVQDVIAKLKMNGKQIRIMHPEGFMTTDTTVSTELPINELYHYGVLGMKWGVRKERESSSQGKSFSRKKKKKPTNKSIVKQPRSPASEDYIKKLQAHNTPLSSMSNAQLRAFNERVQLEQTFIKLTTKPKSQFRQSAEKILKQVAEEKAKGILSAYTEDLLKSAGIKTKYEKQKDEKEPDTNTTAVSTTSQKTKSSKKKKK